MWREFFRFDMQFLRRQSAVLASCGVLCALMLGCAWLPASLVQAFGASTLAAPINLAMLLVMSGIPASFLLAGPVTSSVIRDSQANTLGLLLALPMRPVDYLVGKTMAAFVTAAGVCGVSTLVLAAVAVARSPEMGALHVVAQSLAFFMLLVVPNMLVLVTLVTALAYRTRSVSSVYGGVFLFYLFWAVSAFPVLPVDESTRAWVSALTDPFGGRALVTAIDAVPKAVRNTSGVLTSSAAALIFVNRAVWLFIATAAFAWVLYRGKPFASREKASVPRVHKPFAGVAHLPQFTGMPALRQLLGIVGFDLRFVLRSTAFRILLGGSVVLAIASLVDMQGMYGSVALLTTSMTISMLQQTLPFLLAIVALIVTAEVMHKAADARVADIESAMPVPPLVRCAALFVTALLALAGFAIAIDGIIWLIQVTGGPAGSADTGPWQTLFGMQMVQAFAFIALAAACQSFCRDRLLGYVAFLVLIFGGWLLGHLVPEAAPWQFGSLPEASYSDLTGFGNTIAAWWTVATGWCVLAAALAVLAFVLNARKAVGGVSRKLAGVLAGSCAAIMAGAYYGAVVQGMQVTGPNVSHIEAMHARYEQRYRSYRDQPQPRVRSVDTTVDLYPEKHTATIRGAYTLINASEQPVDRVQLSFNPLAPVQVTLPGARVLVRDEEVGFEVLQLPAPMLPQAQLKLAFSVRIPAGQGDVVTERSSAFNNHDYFPQVGYLERIELTDASARQRYGLPARQGRSAETLRVTDNALEGKADWISLHAVVTTRAGDVAVTAGDLVHTSTADGRTSFEYETRAPILPYFGVVSGTYAQRKLKVGDTWLQIYYSPMHARNVDRLADAATKSMRFYQKQLGAYPHGTLSLMEVAGAQRGAQAYPGMVTFFEGSEFNRSAPAGPLDPLLVLTAHEVGHQWWGSQLVGANAPGSEVLTESMAQFGALSVVKAVAGAEAYDKALDYEQQYYRAGRTPEQPALLQVMPQDKAQTYHQGALTLSKMAGDMGQTRWNAFLASFFEEHHLATGGYPTARTFLAELCDAAPGASCTHATTLMTARAPNL